MGNWCTKETKETTQLLKLNVPIMYVWDRIILITDLYLTRLNLFAWFGGIHWPNLLPHTASCPRRQPRLFPLAGKDSQQRLTRVQLPTQKPQRVGDFINPKKSTQQVWVKAKKIKQAFILSRFWCQLTHDLNQQSWATIFGSSSFLNSELGISSVEVTRKPTPCGSTMFHQPKKPYKCRPCCHLPSVRQYAGQCLKPGLMSAMVQANGLAPGFTTPTMDIAFLPSSSKFHVLNPMNIDLARCIW